MASPPYVPARLVNGDKPITKRWYVVFRCWNADKECLIRKRDYDVNKYKTKADRHAFAKRQIAEFNKLLEAGYYFNPREKKKQDVKVAVNTNKDFTVDQAFRYILPVVKNIKRWDTYNSYNSVAGLWLQFCEAAGWTDWKIKTITQSDVIAWLDYVQTSKKEGEKVSNATRNNYKSFLSAMLTLMVERKILDKNPALGIKGLDEDEGGNIAYTPEQIKTLKKAIQAKESRLWLFISFMLYGFIRPKEISRMQVKMIDLVNNTMYLPGTITKNRKPKHIRISSAFRTYLVQLKLPGHNPNDYIFGFNLDTGIRQLQKNYAGLHHTKIARKLGFGPEYTLYSWKHTGVVLHYKAGIDIKTLQAQIGHQSLEETDIYLKSLNLYVNTEIEDKSPVI